MKSLVSFLISFTFAFNIYAGNGSCKDSLSASDSFKGRVTAYSAIASVMIGTSSLAAFLSTLVDQDSPALSYFVATFLSQLSSLGVYVVGAPIWEPLQSKIRAMSYKKTGQHQEASEIHSFLEKQYYRTNRQLSINEQMSRNILRDYVFMVSIAFENARQSLASGNTQRVARQIAEVAVRLHNLYPDVDPEDPLVISAIHSAFTSFMSPPPDFLNTVELEAQKMDPDFDYHSTFIAWLTDAG